MRISSTIKHLWWLSRRYVAEGFYKVKQSEPTEEKKLSIWWKIKTWAGIKN